MTQNVDMDIHLAVRAFKIGNKVRELRQKNRYTLQDLAAKTGLSKPFLSQIENNHVVPPVATLLKLARGLDVGMSYFFEDEIDNDKIAITRQAESRRIEKRPHQEKGEVGYTYFSLETKKSHKRMDPYLIEFPVQESDEMVFTSHDGEEFIYVLEGTLEFRTVDRIEVLNTGDAIYIESDVSHSFRCINNKPAKALAVLWANKAACAFCSRGGSEHEQDKV